MRRRAAGKRPPAPCTTHAPVAVDVDAHAERAQRVEHPRVSSASSRPVSVVVPSASAASSSVRLEMLFEPGSATTPSARATARGRACAPRRGASCVRRRSRRRLAALMASRYVAALARRGVAPAAARIGGAAQHGLERRPSPCAIDSAARRARRDSASSSASSASRLASAMSRHISGELAGDAREIAKAAAGVARSTRRRPGATRARRRARTRAGAAGATPRRRSRSWRAGIEPRDARAARRPQRRRRARSAAARRLGQRRQDHLAAAKSDASPAAAPVRSLPAIGWPGTKRGRRAPSVARAASDDVLLGAAGVGDDGAAGRARGASAVEQRRVLRDRCRDQHDVGVGDLARPVVVERHAAIDHAARDARVEIRLRAADADDLRRRRPRAQRERARAADQADADDDELVDAHGALPIDARLRRCERGEEALVLRAAGRR